jgi:hypothetical protein
MWNTLIFEAFVTAIEPSLSMYTAISMSRITCIQLFQLEGTLSLPAAYFSQLPII